MKKIVLILLLLFLIGCSPELPPEETETQEEVACVTAADCAKAGCSSQLCVSKDLASEIVTTCEYREEYDCYREASCGCIEGKCGWEPEQQVKDCVASKQGTGFLIVE